MASSNASLVMVNKPINKVTFARFCFVALRFHENITLTEITYFSKVESFQDPEVSEASVHPTQQFAYPPGCTKCNKYGM